MKQSHEVSSLEETAFWEQTLQRPPLDMDGIALEDYPPALLLGRWRCHEDTLGDDSLARQGDKCDAWEAPSRLTSVDTLPAVRAAWTLTSARQNRLLAG